MTGESTACFILAGGRSTRFGSDKAMAPLRGATLLSGAVATARAAGFWPRVVTRNFAGYASVIAPFVVAECAHRGPVEGLRAALTGTRSETALFLAVDMPDVTRGMLRGLVDDFPADCHVMCYRSGDRIHPFPGIYRRDPTLGAASDCAAMRELVSRLTVRFLPDPGDGSLRNVNTPEDLG